jgi:hypothetical protein
MQAKSQGVSQHLFAGLKHTVRKKEYLSSFIVDLENMAVWKEKSTST